MHHEPTHIWIQQRYTEGVTPSVLQHQLLVLFALGGSTTVRTTQSETARTSAAVTSKDLAGVATSVIARIMIVD